MSRVVQKLQKSLILSVMVGAIAACQPASNTTSESATDTVPTQPTEQPESNSTAAKNTDAEATATSSEVLSTQSKSPTLQPVPKLPAECTSPDTQTAMNTCAQAEYAQADVQLNNAYQTAKAGLGSEQNTQLITAEEAWIAYRDLYCDFAQAQVAGGSMQPLVYYTCLTQLTQDRTAILEQTAPPSISYESADQELNAVYQDLQAALTAQEQTQLTDAQLAWLDYRDAHCAFAGGDTNICLAQVTLQQNQMLGEQLDSRLL